MTPDVYMPWALTVFTAVFLPSVGFLIRSTVTNDQKLKTHEATDALRFLQIQNSLGEIKTEAESQSGKLDMLVDRLPRKRAR